MQARRFFPLFCLCAAAAGQQSTSSHGGWNFSDTVAAMTDVVVGDIVSGTRSDDGAQISATAKVRVVRVMQGSLTPGADVTLAWHYAARGPLGGTGTLPAVRALFFLRKTGSGFEALQATASPLPDPHYVELPQAPIPGGLLYMPDLPPQAKIAHELAWGLEDLATRHAADLMAPQAPSAAPLPGAATRQKFQALAFTLQELDEKYLGDVYQFLSLQVDPNLKLIGLDGRLHGGDWNAVFQIERDLTRLSKAVPGGPGAPSIMSLNLSQNLPAAHAIARIALSDTPIPGWAGGLSMRLGSTQSLEFLPYLNVMLDSPQSSERGSTLMAYCELLEGNKTFWKAEMRTYCPMKSPMGDPAGEHADIAFWKQWYSQNLSEIQKMAPQPQVIAPARFSAPPLTQDVEVTMEMRFSSVVNASTISFDHSHTSGGEIIPSPPRPDIFGGQLPPADREIFHRIVDGVQAKIEDGKKAASEILTAARVAGVPPDRQKLNGIEAQRQAALKSGLTDLQNQLSPEGWKKLESEMMRIAISASRVISPPK